ncbi:MAG: biotin--[acetyl-CoA-carboxylase] ligase [Desulfurococcales archaeon]|nr:biotin--[acetyl-CoA-carboxylase] ligase [Desulfurococcales archaeon]
MEIITKVLRELLKANDYVTGSELAARLGTSKPTLHRAIDYLRKVGYVIESHPRRGYRILLTDDLAEAGAHLKDLGTRVKFSVHYISSCTSTQDIAEALAREGASEGTVVIAESMTSGRGRLGRKWVAGKGGLWMTVLLRPPTIVNLQLLSLCAGVAVAKAVADLYGIKAELKWPNDVIIGSRKLCGILSEGRAEADRVHYVLIGIGINVNNDLPEHLKATAVTLKELVGHPVPRTPLLRAVLKNLDIGYELLVSGEGVKVVKLWKNYSGTLGNYVKVITSEKVIEGYAADVDADGALIVEVGGGRREVIYSGDVVHLRRRDLSA